MTNAPRHICGDDSYCSRCYPQGPANAPTEDDYRGALHLAATQVKAKASRATFAKGGLHDP